jgi:hypothetical protein
MVIPKIEDNTYMKITEINVPITMSKSEVARQLGVSRAYVTMLSQGRGRLTRRKSEVRVFYRTPLTLSIHFLNNGGTI